MQAGKKHDSRSPICKLRTVKQVTMFVVKKLVFSGEENQDRSSIRYENDITAGERPTARETTR